MWNNQKVALHHDTVEQIYNLIKDYIIFDISILVFITV